MNAFIEIRSEPYTSRLQPTVGWGWSNDKVFVIRKLGCCRAKFFGEVRHRVEVWSLLVLATARVETACLVQGPLDASA
jgi:hypothetical protein